MTATLTAKAMDTCGCARTLRSCHACKLLEMDAGASGGCLPLGLLISRLKVRFLPRSPKESGTCVSVWPLCFAVDSQLDSHRAKNLIHLRRHLPPHCRDDVAIRVEGQADLRVTKDVHHETRMYTLG